MENILLDQIKALTSKDLPLITNLSNTSAVLNQFENINWCGFYLAKGETLYLGPFQGEPACTVIPFGKGVCGTAAKEKRTIIVDDVNKFEGHIACSALSKSEIVVPIIKNNKVVGVIDIDSPIYNRFNEDNKKALQEIAALLSELFND